MTAQQRPSCSKSVTRINIFAGYWRLIFVWQYAHISADRDLYRFAVYENHVPAQYSADDDSDNARCRWGSYAIFGGLRAVAVSDTYSVLLAMAVAVVFLALS